jgi:hypothetical protein
LAQPSITDRAATKTAPKGPVQLQITPTSIFEPFGAGADCFGPDFVLPPLEEHAEAVSRMATTAATTETTLRLRDIYSTFRGRSAAVTKPIEPPPAHYAFTSRSGVIHPQRADIRKQPESLII